jgi:hypothetical protein
MEAMGQEYPTNLCSKQRLAVAACQTTSLICGHQEHGLQAVHSSTKLGSTVVTLKCSKVQEEANYTQDSESGDTFKVYEHLHTICAALPVHVVFGERDDVMFVLVQCLVSVSHKGVTGHALPRIYSYGVIAWQASPAFPTLGIRWVHDALD